MLNPIFLNVNIYHYNLYGTKMYYIKIFIPLANGEYAVILHYRKISDGNAKCNILNWMCRS